MDPELPGYAEATVAAPLQSSSNTVQRRSEQSMSLQDSNGFKWLTLTVKSRAARFTSLPVFYEGDVVSGHVDFDVLQPVSIKGISIQLTAGTTFVGQAEQLFLDEETDLWTPAMSLPDGSTVTKFAQGRYTWPFSFTLPTSVELQHQETKKNFPLPTSFSERAGTTYLDYKLTVTVKRGLLKFDKTLVTTFAYFPVVRPGLPSPMLRKAYKENLPFIGPEGDSDGWHTLTPLTIQGKAFNVHAVEATVTLSLAKPLTYARGSAIPLWLMFEGDDEQALDLLSNPKAVKLVLVRSLATGSHAMSDTDLRTDNCFFETVARAVFWPSEDYRSQGRRSLQGEVDLKPSLKPSTLFPRFTISYHLALQPFDVVGFVATAPKNTPLLSQKVTIANFPALGCRICPRAPPEYLGSEQSPDYAKSYGTLLNRKIRFYHNGAGRST